MPAWLLSALGWVGTKVLKWFQKRIIKRIIKAARAELEKVTYKLEQQAYDLGYDFSVQLSKYAGKVGQPELGDELLEPSLFRILDAAKKGAKAHRG